MCPKHILSAVVHRQRKRGEHGRATGSLEGSVEEVKGGSRWGGGDVSGTVTLVNDGDERGFEGVLKLIEGSALSSCRVLHRQKKVVATI